MVTLTYVSSELMRITITGRDVEVGEQKATSARNWNLLRFASLAAPAADDQGATPSS